MNRKTNLIPALLLSALSLYAMEDVKVTQFQHAGPFTVNKPILADSLNVNGKPFEAKNLLKATLPFEQTLANATVLDADTAGAITFAAPQKGYALHLFSFFLNSDRYVKGTLDISGPGAFEVFVNDKPVGASSELVMEPRRYQVVVKYLTAETDTCPPSLKATFKSEAEAKVVASLNPEKRYTLLNILEGKDFQGVSVSPNGKYALVKYVNRFPEGKSESYGQLMDAATGRVLLQDGSFLTTAKWMPKSNRLYYTRTGLDGTELVTVDPATYQQTVLVPNLPKGRFVFTPDESTLLYTVEEEGPKEGTELIRVLEPADRIPDFRDRSFIWRYDLKTGLYEQLTFGHTDTYINDISADSRYLLFSTSDRVYTSLPHSRNSLYKLDLQTMAIDTIWEKAPYVNQAAFSPDGKQLLVAGAGDAFDGIGQNIKQGQISNSYDGQLFLYDLASRKASPLTKDFNPNVIDAVWNRFNGQIYILCEDEDYQRIYTCDPANGKIKQVAASEDIIMSYALADNAPVLFYYGQSASNANRLYAYDLKGGKNRLVYDLSQDKLKDIALGEVHDWNFKSDDGTTIQGRYYLPPHFDPNKKYPMIVYYYGGTSPTNRALEMRYSMHMYAALGYVVYTLNPSGTTGFGQEFAARHVNAWGLKTADEIIQGTKLFCKEHSFVNEKKIEGISYINDESDRNGLRIIIILKHDAVASVVLNTLFKNTPLQTSFAVNNIALVNGRPQMLPMRDLVKHFVDHRHDVVVRRARFDLKKAEERLHIVQGLLIAQDNIDEIVHIIRSSQTPDAAKQTMIERFNLSDIQASAIIEMRLRALTGLEYGKLIAERDELTKQIAYLKEVLENVGMQMQIIKDELLEIKEKYGDERRSEIVYSSEEFNPEDFYADDDMVITISHMGYIKRTPLAEYRTQNRGGVGAKGSATRDEDFIEHIYVASMHNTMLFFTEKGRCFWLKVYEIPEGARSSKGRAIQNVIQIEPDDKVRAYINVKRLNDEEYVNNNFIIMCTKDGTIKKTKLEAYSRPRQNGVNAIVIREGDQLIEAKLTSGQAEVMIAARDGKAIRFNESTVRPIGRVGAGVRGISIEESDEVVGMICVEPDSKQDVLVLSENGYGKRTDLDEYRITNRGGKGVKTINVTEKTGKLISIQAVTDDNDLMIINRSGLTIRTAVSQIRLAGRATQGVRIINLREGDAIASVMAVPAAGDEDEEVQSAEVAATGNDATPEADRPAEE